MQEYVAKYKGLIKALKCEFKPNGWVGKNWACYQGYLHCKGDLLLFTDADTQYNFQVLKLVILSVATASRCCYRHSEISLHRFMDQDYIANAICFPPYSTFCVACEQSKDKNWLFFQQLYLITRSSYEAVGTHKIVKHGS